MTLEQLEKANEIQEEINRLNATFTMLDSTIAFEENKGRPPKSFMRLINCAMKMSEEPKAHAFLFRDNSIHGRDIPVDLDFLKYLRSYFQDRLNEKKKELGDI